MSFEGKVVLIIGGSSGLGADAARHLAGMGAQVSIVGRRKNGLNEVAEQIKKSTGRIPLVIVVGDTKDPEQIVNETIKYFGKLDILINNDSREVHDNVCSLDFRHYNEIFDTNVRKFVELTKLCVPFLEKTKGNIINVSRAAGLTTCPDLLSYSMAKAAFDQFSKCCALDLASKGIRVNAIYPSPDGSPIFGTQAEQVVARTGEFASTSHAIAFLANDQTASFLTGIELPVDR